MKNALQRSLPWLPTFLVLFAAGALVWYGPITQLPHYHDFADRRSLFDLPNGLDVLSNLGFALVALWGLIRLTPQRRHSALNNGWPGYLLFLLALLLTACGSSFYHLAPDNTRLIWDRIPIALACVGLLVAVWSELRPGIDARGLTAQLGVLAVISVFWWYFSGEAGEGGDLRPYLFFQCAPLLLIPLWQWIYRAPRRDRFVFGMAILCYAAAKAAELNDQLLFSELGTISGHSLKHILATLAAALIVLRLRERVGTEKKTKKTEKGLYGTLSPLS